ncbi:MAG: HAD hydrolase-like protein, partial [Sorangiineae bacterium]|nr:HAD hydrolase-like protein [Sorangiineae bacterium]
MTPAPVCGVVFDLDGTLVDSREDIVRSTNHALAVSGYPTLPAGEIASYVGDGARLLLARSSRLLAGDPRLDALETTFLEYYTAHAVDHTRLIAGVEEVLDALAPLPLALLTNKPRRATLATLAALGLDRRLREIVAGDDLAERKPAPGGLLTIARRLALEPR